MWKKVLAILFSSVVMMFIMGYGLSFYLASTGPNAEEVDSAQEEIEDIFLGEKILGPSIGNDEFFEVAKKDKFLTEEVLLETIHSMSHQKVKADQKWGTGILITKERVEILLEIVKENRDKLEHSETYLDILNRWYVGDFSKANKDHNAIWKIQDGNIGKAYDVLNAVEELKYIEEYHIR